MGGLVDIPLSRLSVARSGTATRVNASGLIETVAANTPRLDFDPVSLACRGLLVEEARTNLFTYSEQFDNAAWTKSSCTVVANSTASPDGTTSADSIVEAAGSGLNPLMQRSMSFTSGTSYAFSCFGKEISGSAKRYLTLLFPSSQFSLNIRATIDLATGSVVTVNSPISFSSSYIGGFWRISVAATATATGSGNIQIRSSIDSSGSFTTYTGDGSSGFILWGAQIEVGASQSSYIPTTSATVTRNADVVTTPLNQWFTAGPGTAVVDGLIGVASPSGPMAVIQDASGDNRYQIGAGSAAAVAAGTTTAFLTATAPTTVGSVARSAFAWATDDFALSANGSAVSTDASGAIPAGLTTLTIGKYTFGGAQSWNGWIRRIQYAPRRLANSELISASGGTSIPAASTSFATGNCLLSWVNSLDSAATTITSTSSASGLGPERLKDPQVRKRMRTAVGVVNPTLTVDFGSAKEVGVLAVLQPDDPGYIDADGAPVGYMAAADTIRHRLDATTAGSGALYDSLYYRPSSYTGATLDLNFASQSYREFQNDAGSGIVSGYGMSAYVMPAAVSPRYWQCDIAASSLATTPGYLDIGRLWCGPAWRPTRNFAYEWSDEWDDLSEVTQVRRSGQEFVDLAPKKRVLTFGLKALTEPEAKIFMKELGRIVGTSKQVLFIQEPNGAYEGYEAIIGRLVEVAPITQPNFALYERVFQIRQSL